METIAFLQASKLSSHPKNIYSSMHQKLNFHWFAKFNLLWTKFV